MRRLLPVLVALPAALVAQQPPGAGSQPAATTARRESVPASPSYLVYVASEGNDQIQLVRFDGSAAMVERSRRIGTNPTELVGPHGIAVSPDGRYYYVSTAHGTPYGALWKFTTSGDSLVGRVELGAFPATLQVSPDGAYVWVVNFNLYGDPVRSSVSVVYADQMVEVARIPTCVMPHGSRLDARGTRHYSVCMMSDALVEIDARTLAVARHFIVTKGSEHGMAGTPMAPETLAQAGHAGAHDPASSAGSGHGMAPPKPGDASCSPTWAQPSADGRYVYVACNRTNDVVEVDVAAWTMRRRLPAGDGVYNLAATRDGRLLVGTNKRGQSVSVIDLASGAELARVPTTRKLPSGVAISPDDRYAFVTLEGIGSQPGTVDVIDLRNRARVASVDVGQQAGGVDVWKVEAVR